MLVPEWVLIVVGLIIVWLFTMVFQLINRVKKLRRIIRKMEYPDEEGDGKYSETGDGGMG